MLGTIHRLVAITSCKGGVGKSTLTLELGLELSRRGHRVGLYDSDVHGPSLPTQLPEVGSQLIRLAADGRSVLPLEFRGLKVMSFGWFSKLWSRRPAAEIRVRGPLATNLLQTTAWGELDFLLIDSPPGTGDIPTQIATKLPLHGAVVVTTPSGLAAVDVVRGMLHLRKHGVRVLALVENMASFRCDGCEKDHFPFGQGHANDVLARVMSAEKTSAHGSISDIPTFSLPIAPTAGNGYDPQEGDTSSPLACALVALTDSLESGTAQAARLPHKLSFGDHPHWPTEMAMAEYTEGLPY